MTSQAQQECSQCRHLNPATAIVCDLCGWALAKEGMTLTYHPGASNNPNSDFNNTPAKAASVTENFSSDDETIAPKNVDTETHQAGIDADNSTEHTSDNGMAHFKISEVLGQGGMGAVYKAQDLTLQRFVALKLFRSQLSDTVGNGQQLLDEARLACKLNHPNIVTIYDIARGQDSNFIVMEWVDGQSLDTIIPENGLPQDKAMEYACQIIDGLVCAHQNGIIHRDIKPQNIMLNSENRIKILDFGIADLLHQPTQQQEQSEASIEAEQDQTRIGELVGTPQYMAPEQAFGQEVDQRADIFAFGILLYEMLTGQRPFAGKNINEIKEALSKGAYPPVSHLRPDLPTSIETMIDKMLAADISLRWQNSNELAGEIHKIYNLLTKQKNWWQRLHWLGKTAMILPLIFILSWNLKEVIFPPTTNDLIERQLLEAKKIAILPFDNISGDPLLEIFNDGLVSSLSSDLTKAGREQGDGTTWVIPSREIRRMKQPSVQKVSDKFGVDLLLTGSVQHMGSTRLFVLNLLNAKDGRQLTTSELSISADKLFQGQQKIRRQVLALLNWKISEELTKEFSAERPKLDGAYKEYIEGQGYLYRYDQAGNLNKALKGFARAIQLDSEYQLAYAGLASAQFAHFHRTKNSEWLDRMAITINKLRTINPEHPLISYLSADLIVQKGQYEQAIKLFQSSIQQDSKHINSYLGLAKAYAKNGNNLRAEKIYQNIINISPNNWRARAILGVFYFRNGNHVDAVEQFKQLAQMAPNNNYAFLNLAASYYSLGRIEEAIQNTELALKINPTKSAYSNLATMYFYNKNYKNATVAYEKAIALSDSDYVVWGNLADAYRFSQNAKSRSAYNQAVKLALKALELNPKDTTVVADLAYYFANLGQREQTLEYAKRIDSNNTGTDNFMVATAYDLLGESELTLIHITNAIDKNYSLDEIRSSPLLEKVRKDERFKHLINNQ